MKIKAQTLALALEAIKEREAELRSKWLAENEGETAELLLVRKNAYQIARIELEIKLAGITAEIEVTE